MLEITHVIVIRIEIGYVSMKRAFYGLNWLDVGVYLEQVYMISLNVKNWLNADYGGMRNRSFNDSMVWLSMLSGNL